MAQQQLDEKAVMLQVRDGHVAQLGLLFERNKVKLYNFFRRLGNSPEVSEDLVQETFMRVLAYRTSFNGDSQFSTWLFGIARNTSVDHFRKNKNAANQDSIDDDNYQEQVSVETCLTTNMANQQQHQLFNQALNKIDAESREIILLSRFGQLRYEQIAELIDCNLNTLKSRMTSAITKLKLSYQSLIGEEHS